MNTSQSGHSRLMSGSQGAGGALLGMGERGLADPGTLLPGVDACLQALAVAGAVAPDDLVELVPVDLAEVVVAALLVPLQLRIGDGEAQKVGLRHGLVDEALP